MRVCTFTGEEIEPGTGLLYVKKNGEVLHYKNRKAFKNHQQLKRVPRYVRWSKHHVKHQ